MSKLTSKIIEEFSVNIRGSSYHCQILNYKRPIRRKNFKWCSSCVPETKLITGTICARLVAEDNMAYYLCAECTKSVCENV